ncbi:MAG: alpha/beta hydrolase, partial [Burkholderiaceae bacterium]
PASASPDVGFDRAAPVAPAKAADVDGQRRERSSERHVRVFFGTDRARVAGSAPGIEQFGGERSTLQFGSANVSIPPGHRLGEVERPKWYRLEFSPSPRKHVMLTQAGRLDQRAFVAAMNDMIRKDAKPSSFVFVHGYNVKFEDALLRTAQMAVDTGLLSVPILYSWPSQGNVAAYTVDEANAEWARQDLLRFLDVLATESTAAEIVVIAHSMGSRPATWALETLLRDRPELGARFRGLVLAAPDLDAEVFVRDIMPALSPLHDRMTLYASSKDRALAASFKVHGSVRAGSTAGGVVLAPGLETIDASVIDTDFLGHSYLVSDRNLLTDLGLLLGRELRADKRIYLEERAGAGRRYWAFKP